MDLKTFKKKFIKNGFSKWATAVLLAMTVLFIILGLIKNMSGEKYAQLLKDHKEDEGTYAFIDVAAFDEWVCTYGDETYYLLFDRSGEAYLAVVSNSVMKDMERKASAVEEYTHYFDDSYRLYGLVKSTSYQVISNVEDVYGLDADQYRQYFGKCYINTTENPNTNRAWMWWTFSIFSGMFGLVFLIIWLGSESQFNKECRNFTEEEFAEAARMLDENDKKQQIIFGDDFVICREPAMLMRYSDMLWMHLVDTYYYGAKMGRSVRVYSRSKNSFKIYPTIKDSESELNDIMNRILDKKPDILVGYNNGNLKQYRALTKK